jgi:hypothetical protein
LAQVLETVRTLLVRLMALIAADAGLRMAVPRPLLYGERSRAAAMAVDARLAFLGGIRGTLRHVGRFLGRGWGVDKQEGAEERVWFA